MRNQTARLRAGAILAVLLSVMVSMTSAPVSAEEVGADKIWLGPGCPGPADGWTCQPAGSVVQATETGRPLTATCTLDVCQITQTNTTGPNTIVVDQTISNSASGGLLGSLTQDESQSALLLQGNISGTNSITVGQTITLDATSTLTLPSTVQSQEAHQTVNIPVQQSDSGDQDITVSQLLDVSATAEGISVVQNQNTREQIGQYVRIGSDLPGDVGMDTDTGTNAVVVNQTQDFTADATGALGLPTLLQSVQNQGSQNQAFPAADFTWKVNSKVFGGSDVQGNQEKDILQGTSPDAPLLGKVQNIFDELAVLGQLLTTDTSTVNQEAHLVQDGSYARCVQHGQVHNEINGTLNQNCNGQEQSVSGASYEAHLEQCNGTPPPGEECDPDNTFTRVDEEGFEPGDEGCGQGFWKNHTGDWEVVQTGDAYGSHFEDAPAPFATMTMLQAVNLGGGPVNNLVRQSVAALLNAEHSEVEYVFHPKQVREKVNTAFTSGTETTVAQELEAANQGPGGCPIEPPPE